MRFLSLFSGIGGLDLGLERAGWSVAGQVEGDAYCRAVLAKHWPRTPRWGDIRSVSATDILTDLGRVDAIAGGFPCQNISFAGRGGGLSGPSSGLWWEMHRLVERLRPGWVLIENVPALRTRGADDVIAALEALDYTCWPLVVGAEDVGAPHHRKRVFIVANLGAVTRAGRALRQEEASRWPQELADPTSWRGQAGPIKHGEAPEDGRHHAVGRREARWPARPGEPQHDWEEERLTQPSMGRSTHGVPGRLGRSLRRRAIRAYGNAVVPQVAEVVGRAILAVARQ